MGRLRVAPTNGARALLAWAAPLAASASSSLEAGPEGMESARTARPRRCATLELLVRRWLGPAWRKTPTATAGV